MDNRSFSRRLKISDRVTYLVLLVLCASFIALGLGLHQAYHRETARQNQEQQQNSLELTSAAISHAAWTFDDVSLKQIVDDFAEKNSSFIVGIRIVDPVSKKVWVEKQNLNSRIIANWQELSQNPKHLVRTKIVYYQKNPVASLEMLFTSQDSATRETLISVYILLFTLLALVLSVIAIHTLLRRMLSMPILEFMRASSEIEKQNFSVLLNEDFQGELGELAVRFNKALSAIKLRDEKLNNYTANLESLVLEKITELDTERTKAMNSARLASLGEMAGGVAHEINNPLMIIQGKIEMIRRDSETSPAREQILKHTDRVSVAVERIARIVKSLREFAREGSFEPMQNFLVGNVVDDLKNLCQNRISNSKIDLRIDIDPPEAAVFGSSVQILQVLVSLVGNSIDSLFKQIELHRPMQENLTPALTEPNLPTPSLWISLSIKDLGHAIEFSVTDSGPALDTKIQDKLFQPFFTTKEIGQGTGIGLSTAMGIIKNHGGDIYYDAQSPHARFVFVLPKNDSKKIAA